MAPYDCIWIVIGLMIAYALFILAYGIWGG